MSYSIFKYFNIKNGQAVMTVAESNVFNVTCDRRGRECQSRVFRQQTYDFHIGEQSYGGVTNNKWYGKTDAALYTRWMLSSAFSGDKYYEEKHKSAIALIQEWVEKKNDANLKVFLSTQNITPQQWSELSWQDKHRKFDKYRIYTDPTNEELSELQKLLEENAKLFKRRKRTVVVFLQGDPDHQHWVTAISARTATISSSPPNTPTSFSDVQIARLQKHYGIQNVKIL